MRQQLRGWRRGGSLSILQILQTSANQARGFARKRRPTERRGGSTVRWTGEDCVGLVRVMVPALLPKEILQSRHVGHVKYGVCDRCVHGVPACLLANCRCSALNSMLV